MDELEVLLKQAYNNYIDSLVNYLNQCKQEPGDKNFKVNNATKYILDNNISMGFRDSLEIVRAADTSKLLAKKVI